MSTTSLREEKNKSLRLNEEKRKPKKKTRQRES
jgi:hypothetical protein